MSQREDECGVGRDIVAIERDVPAASARNQEFAQTGFGQAAYERVLLEDAQAVDQDVRRSRCAGFIALDQKFRNALDVRKRSRRQYQPRHDRSYSLRGAGCLRRRPWTLALM